MPAPQVKGRMVQTLSSAPPKARSEATKPGVVRSMTGYGRAALDETPRVTAEIRAVNNRFLKLGIKVPSRLGALEDRIKTLLSEMGIKRGSIDVSLFFEGADEESAYSLSEVVLKKYAQQARQIAKKSKLKADIPISALLPLPGVVTRADAAEDIDVVWARGRKALLLAIKDFDQMREREGHAMATDVRAQLAQLALHRSVILTLAPEALKGTIQKFKDRIAKLLDQAKVSAPLNPDALEREVVLMADRTDVSEELARLQSHFAQMEAALAAGGEAGKRLDFLTQELLRETNTIGSKAQDERITHRVVDMKGIIEKIREQVQNLE